MQLLVSMCKTCTQHRLTQPELARGRESQNRVGKPGPQRYTAHPLPPHCCAMTHLGSPDLSLRVSPGSLLYLSSCPLLWLPPRSVPLSPTPISHLV